MKIVLMVIIFVSLTGCSAIFNKKVDVTRTSTQGIIIDEETNETIEDVFIIENEFEFKSTKRGDFLIPRGEERIISIPPMSRQSAPIDYLFIVGKDSYETKVCISTFVPEGSKNIIIPLKRDDTVQGIDKDKLFRIYIYYRNRPYWRMENTKSVGKDVSCFVSLKKD